MTDLARDCLVRVQTRDKKQPVWAVLFQSFYFEVCSIARESLGLVSDYIWLIGLASCQKKTTCLSRRLRWPRASFWKLQAPRHFYKSSNTSWSCLKIADSRWFFAHSRGWYLRLAGLRSKVYYVSENQPKLLKRLVKYHKPELRSDDAMKEKGTLSWYYTNPKMLSLIKFKVMIFFFN